MARKKYALVGTGGRSVMFLQAILDDYSDVAELVALADVNQTRMDFHNRKLQDDKHDPLPTYHAADFDRMIEEQKPDTVIVTTVDRTHHKYACRAMELGCDVISEKPMTTDAEKCQQIIDTVKSTERDLRVTFNYRYAPRNSKIKELIQGGAIGEVLSVHFEWLLNTSHGADYFRRWHRDKRNSGGLMVHKATHHFDLVNWWIGSKPKTVFGMGDLRYYGKENAENRGITDFYSRTYGSKLAENDPFALDMVEGGEYLHGLYLDAEHEDGYYRDQSVFGEGISIEDTMAVMVRYHNKAVMTYSLNAHCPWEGHRVMFNGTKGRIEVNAVEAAYVSGSASDFNLPGLHEIDEPEQGAGNVPELILQAHFEKAHIVDYEEAHGGHGGGDVRLLSDIFRGAGDDPLGRAASYVDGINSIMTGIAANQSFKTGLPVDVSTLYKL